MKKRKKILIGSGIVLLILAVGVSAWYFLKNRNQAVVDVYSLETLNSSDWFGGDSQLTGTVSSDYVQEVYLNGTQDVKKVYVNEGDVVKEGDKLLKYNVDEEELDLKLQRLQIKSSKMELKQMNQDLEKLKKTKAVGSVDTGGTAFMSASQNLNFVKAESLSYLMADAGEKAQEKTSAAQVKEDGNSGMKAASKSEEQGTAEESGSTTEDKGTSEEGGSTTENKGTSEEGGSTTENKGTSEEGGSTTENKGTSEEGGSTTGGTEPSTAPSDDTNTIPADQPYKRIKKIEEKASSSGDGKNEKKAYIYLLVKDGEDEGVIKGSVINQLIAGGIYAVIKEYASVDQFNQGAESLEEIIISPGMQFVSAITEKGYYSVEDLNDDLITADRIKITPSKGFVYTGKAYAFKATVKGTNTDSLAVTWSLSGNKSSATSLVNGVLTVASDETATSLRIKAAAGGKKGAVTIKVKKNPSTSGGSTGGGSSSGGSSGGGDAEETYTASELKEAISDKEDEIAQAKEDLHEARINLKEAKKEVDAATVKATVGGTVTTAYTMDGLPTDGSAAIIIKADDGMFVKASVSEMDLDTVQVGGTITCTSYETNENYEATVKEVSDFPSSGSSSDSASNPNSSYYPIVAYIDNADGLTTGQTVNITYNSQTMGTISSDAIFLQKAYVRSEGKQSYVYKEGKNGKLEKQYVKTGSTMYGQYVEIVSGLTLSDNIAFPYGKNVKEGAKAKLTDNEDNIIY